MTTYSQFTTHVDAIQSALIEKFNVASDTAEEWVLDYIEAMPQLETRASIQVAHEIFMERAV